MINQTKELYIHSKTIYLCNNTLYLCFLSVSETLGQVLNITGQFCPKVVERQQENEQKMKKSISRSY